MCRIKYNEKKKMLELKDCGEPIVQFGVEKILDAKKGKTIMLWNGVQRN